MFKFSCSNGSFRDKLAKGSEAEYGKPSKKNLPFINRILKTEIHRIIADFHRKKTHRDLFPITG